MTNKEPSTNDDLLAAWLACPPATQSEWLRRHQSALTFGFLESLKRESDRNLRTNPQIADQITQGMLQIAKQLVTEALAYPLACWARGNWLAYHDPQQAIGYYQEALTGYQPTNNVFAVLTLLANLLIVSAEIDLRQAWTFYQQIEPMRCYLTNEHDPLLLRIEQNSGILLRRLGRYQEALTTNLRARAIAEANQAVDRVAEINGNLALTYGSIGYFKECEALLLAAAASAEQIHHSVTAARMVMNLGHLYTVLGRPAEALQCFQRARGKFEQVGNRMELGSIALREAHLLERIGALEQAARSYAIAQTHFQNLQMWPQVWLATLEGAVVKRKYGEYSQAANLLDDAAKLWQNQQQDLWHSEWTLEKAALALAQEQLATAKALLTDLPYETPSHLQNSGAQAHWQLLNAVLAEKQWEESQSDTHAANAQQSYQAVLAYAEAHGELRMKRQSLVGLGRLTRQATPAQAKSLLQDAAQQDDLIRMTLSLQELKAAFLSQSNDALETLFTWAYEDGQPMEALTLSWRAKGDALWELITAKQSHQTEQPFLHAVEEIRNRLAASQWQAAIEEQQSHPLQTTIDKHKAEVAQLEQQIIEIRRQHNQQTPQLSAQFPAMWLTQNGEQPLSRVVAAMDADLLIEYMQAQEQIYAIVVDKTGACHVYRLTEVENVLDLMDSLTMTFRALLTPRYQPHKQANFLAECHQLLATGYDLLIRPLQLPVGACKVLVAPCTPLHKMPFAALWDGLHYWVEQHTIEMTPTAILLAAPLSVAPLTHPLVIASSVNGALPSNLEQAAVVREYYPTAISLLDDPNTLGYLQNLTVAPCFVHLTAHTLEREDAPIFTSLHLTNSTLSVEQCYELPLSGCELVTLSSCTTNAGMDSSGALLAFQSAFFVAGVQRILSTLWEIHSETTLAWMGTFYQKLADGCTPAEALRQTQLAFIANPQLCHPAYWAAFTCSRR